MPTKPCTSPKPEQRHERRLVCAFAGPPTSIDEATRSFDIVITTETPVARCVKDPISGTYIEVGEVLAAAGIDLSRAPRMPFIECQDTYTSIDKILSKVDRFSVDVTPPASSTVEKADLSPDIRRHSATVCEALHP